MAALLGEKRSAEIAAVGDQTELIGRIALVDAVVDDDGIAEQQTAQEVVQKLFLVVRNKQRNRKVTSSSERGGGIFVLASLSSMLQLRELMCGGTACSKHDNISESFRSSSASPFCPKRCTALALNSR